MAASKSARLSSIVKRYPPIVKPVGYTPAIKPVVVPQKPQ